MNALIGQLLSRAPVITDGALGTQLRLRGLEPGECPDMWNLTCPDRVEQVARAYVAAGSRVILTNTFRANRIGLSHFGEADCAVELNHSGAEIALRAAAGHAHVFGSMGPSGKILMMGEVEEREIEAAALEQAFALAEGGVEALVLETFSDLQEASIFLRAARQTGLPVIVSMVFDSGKIRDRTLLGATPEQAARQLDAEGADVIGANCGAGMIHAVAICRRLRAASALPLWIKPSAGLPESLNGVMVYRVTPAEFADPVSALAQAGADFIGGCCGTGPEFIRVMAKKLGAAPQHARENDGPNS